MHVSGKVKRKFKKIWESLHERAIKMKKPFFLIKKPKTAIIYKKTNIWIIISEKYTILLNISIYRLHLYPKIQRSTRFNNENRKENATHSQNIRAEKRYVQENEKWFLSLLEIGYGYIIYIIRIGLCTKIAFNCKWCESGAIWLTLKVKIPLISLILGVCARIWTVLVRGRTLTDTETDTHFKWKRTIGFLREGCALIKIFWGGEGGWGRGVESETVIELVPQMKTKTNFLLWNVRFGFRKIPGNYATLLGHTKPHWVSNASNRQRRRI